MAASTYFDQVQQLYIAYFGRPADTVGQAYWAGIIDAANGSIAAVQAGFSASTESQALFGNKSTIDKVTAIYQNVFGRAPEPAGLAFWVAQLDSGKVTQAQASWTIQQNAGAGDAAAVQNKLTAAKAFTAQIDTTAEVVGYQGTGAADAGRAFLATVNQTNATATAAVANAATALATAVNAGGTGSSFALTAGVDNLTGTASNDIFTADNTGATKTLSAADTINGGAGVDTLRVFLAAADATFSNPTLTNVENVLINGGVVAAYTAVAGTTGLTIEAPVVGAVSGALTTAIYTVSGQAVTLKGATVTAASSTTIASGSDAAVNLTVNGWNGAGFNVVALTGTAATANLTATGANSSFQLNGAATLKTLNVTGDKNVSVIAGATSAANLTSVNASTATGAVSVDVSGATTAAAFAFTGGAGNDTIKFADNGLAALTSGAQLDGGAGTADKIAILDTALTTAEYTALNAAKNFEVLGLNAAITVDAAQLTTLKSFSLDTNAAQAITGMKTGSAVALTVAHAATTTLSGAVGVNDVKVDIGTAATAGLAIAGDLTIGQTVVALTSNGTNAAANVITSLKNADNSVVTITGSNDLTISATTATATGSKYDASAFTGKLTIVGNTAAYTANSAKGDVIIGGTNDDTITASVNSSTLTGGLGKDTFIVSTAVAGDVANAAITTITDFAKGDKITFGGTAGAFTAAKVDLTGAANEQAALNLLLAGNNSDVKWGVYNGNTYIVDDAGAGATMAATDTVVKLTGTLDLSTSTFAGNTVTFA